MSNQFPRIEKLAYLGEQRMALVFGDQQIVIADFGRIAKVGGVFAPLADDSFFKRGKLIRGGRALAWPGEIEFCADALYLPLKARRRVAVERAEATLSIPAKATMSGATDFPSAASRKRRLAS